MLGKLKVNEIEDLLKRQVVGRVACHADDQTYIVPISYAYDGSVIYCHTHEGKKLDMMRKNAEVCFEVDELVDMANWKSVIVWGGFEEINDAAEKQQAYEILLNRMLPANSSVTTHLGSTWPFSADEIDNMTGIVFRINITEKTGRFESSEVIHVTDHL